MASPRGHESLEVADLVRRPLAQALFLDRGVMLAWVTLVAGIAWLFVAVFVGAAR